MDLSLADARAQQADVIIANDPDADRCAAGIRMGTTTACSPGTKSVRCSVGGSPSVVGGKGPRREGVRAVHRFRDPAGADRRRGRSQVRHDADRV